MKHPGILVFIFGKHLKEVEQVAIGNDGIET